jgi:putative flippase GtrA
MAGTASQFVEHRHIRGADATQRARWHRKLAVVPGMLPQFSRYALVSALALILDFAIYLLLAAGGTKVALAGALGYACGLALHYVLSVRYVFDARAAHKGQSRLFAEFAVSGFAGIAITALVIAAAVDTGGMPLLPAKALAVGVSFLVVFVLRRSVVFADCWS